jgi:hypothetical protein
VLVRAIQRDDRHVVVDGDANALAHGPTLRQTSTNRPPT